MPADKAQCNVPGSPCESAESSGQRGGNVVTKEPADRADEQLGFDLRKVSWGYRRIFADAIRRLLADGDIGPGREEVTRTFKAMLDHSRPGSFDFALKEFLAGLNPRTKWLLELPGMFEDFCALGRELTEEKLAHGIAFFRLWGEGAFGDSPGQLRELLRHVRALRGLDAELAQGFMLGYGKLIRLLDTHQVNLFVAELVRLHQRNPRTAVDFAALRLKSALAYVRNLTQEARLEDMTDRLERLARALADRKIEIDNLSGLDSDEVIERNCMVVCFLDHLYLPARIRLEPSRRLNESLYLLATVLSAEAVRAKGFPAIHGRPGAASIAEWLGDRPLAALVSIIDTTRIVRQVRRKMPGARRLVDFAIRREFELIPPQTATDELLRQCLAAGRTPDDPLVAGILAAADDAESCFDSARLARPMLEGFLRRADAPPRALAFFPDFYYPGGAGTPPTSALVADLRKARRRGKPAEGEGQDRSAAAKEAEAAEEEAPVVPAAFVYPEWNQNENDYYENWCFLREHRVEPDAHFRRPAGDEDHHAIARARRMFERLKPELVRKEKYLAYGDEIDIDRLVEYMALKRRQPAPRVRFYQKPLIKRRDLAVALLLDVSGSTAAVAGEPDRGAGATARAAVGRRIIDVEKRAALTLGAGLEALGDRFAIYGFSGNGREHCDFFIYKDFDEPFSAEVRHRLAAANPTASTRIGVALRHCREKLAAVVARKKIIILITDGRPQDAGYDPASRYAQYDVRMAVLECARKDIHVVCISTLENSRADLEIMFPHRRFVILEDMSRLVNVLPTLYLKMTT